MSTTKTTAERIKLAPNMLGLTRKVLQEKCQISASTMQEWELGRNPLTSKSAKRLSSIFAQLGVLCSDNWLLTGDGRFPTFLQESENLPVVFTEDMYIIREIEAYKMINPDPEVIIIADDSMAPIYNIGDYVAGNKKYGKEIYELIGSICIIETSHGDVFARKILLGKKESFYNLACINSFSHEQPLILDVKLHYAAKIVWHRLERIIKINPIRQNKF